MVSWKVIKDECDSRGTFTQLIKWVPPEGNGYIVQYVTVEDSDHLLDGYKQPYYEAWKVEQGLVVDDTPGPKEYDDSFSNCCDGTSPVLTHRIYELVKEKMKKANKTSSSIAYHCEVFWVPEGSEGFTEIDGWKRADEENIKMAGKLRASYVLEADIGTGKKREFQADFQL